MKPTTLGLIVGNRGFFPKHLCVTGRETMLRVLESEGIRAIAIGLDETPYGSVESLTDAHKLRRPVQGPPPAKSTACSSRCPTSATSAPSPTPCAGRG